MKSMIFVGTQRHELYGHGKVSRDFFQARSVFSDYGRDMDFYGNEDAFLRHVSSSDEEG